MKNQRRSLTVTIVTFITTVFVTSGALVSAQERVPPKRERDVTIITSGAPFPPDVLVNAGSEGHTYSFIASEMSFDGKVVKGAPYSAEAVTETTQPLTDGNRIVRKTTAAVYRDSEGRTRRDQTLGPIGPFATAGDPPQTIFINDPVAGVNYILDPRSRTARKLMLPSGNAKPAGLPFDTSKGPLGSHVQPVYPAAAKAASVEGDVSVRVVTNDAGEVTSAAATEGHPLLRQAATDAVKQWRFASGTTREESKKTETIVNFKFNLPGSVSYRYSLPGNISRSYNFNVSASGDVTTASNSPDTPDALRIAIPHNGAGIEHLGSPPHQPVTEPLGKRMIEGIEAEGTRTTTTIPAGEIGNQLPIQIVSERWYAPALQTVVMTKRSDPRMGETVYRLTNINRSEPARQFFEVPADYQIKQGAGPLIRTYRTQRFNNSNDK